MSDKIAAESVVLQGEEPGPEEQPQAQPLTAGKVSNTAGATDGWKRFLLKTKYKLGEKKTLYKAEGRLQRGGPVSPAGLRF